MSGALVRYYTNVTCNKFSIKIIRLNWSQYRSCSLMYDERGTFSPSSPSPNAQTLKAVFRKQVRSSVEFEKYRLHLVVAQKRVNSWNRDQSADKELQFLNICKLTFLDGLPFSDCSCILLDAITLFAPLANWRLMAKIGENINFKFSGRYYVFEVWLEGFCVFSCRSVEMGSNPDSFMIFAKALEYGDFKSKCDLSRFVN